MIQQLFKFQLLPFNLKIRFKPFWWRALYAVICNLPCDICETYSSIHQNPKSPQMMLLIWDYFLKSTGYRGKANAFKTFRAFKSTLVKALAAASELSWFPPPAFKEFKSREVGGVLLGRALGRPRPRTTIPVRPWGARGKPGRRRAVRRRREAAMEEKLQRVPVGLGRGAVVSVRGFLEVGPVLGPS